METGNRIRERTGSVSDRRRPYWRTLALSAAASVALISAVAVLLLRPVPPEFEPVRQADADAAPANYVSLRVPPSELVLPLSGTEGDVIVSMFDSNGALLWSIDDVAGDRLLLDEANRQPIAVGGTYYWVMVTTSGTEFGPYWFHVE